MEIRCFSCEWVSQCHRDLKMLEAGGDGAFIMGPCDSYEKVPPRIVAHTRPTKFKRCNPLSSHPYNVSFLLQK